MCKQCLQDGNTTRHSNPRWGERQKPQREHGTYRGCRQHWCRGETLCDECEDHYLSRRKSVPLTLYLGEDSIRSLDSLAKEKRMTRNQLMRIALTNYLVLA